MKTTIVLAHPWHGSFNKAILDVVEKEMKNKNKDTVLIDLNKDQFNPVMQEAELALFSKGQYLDEQVKKYQTILTDSDELIFIFPVWWYNLPAILKGFLDKVILKSFAYQEAKAGIKGLLTQIKQATVITTSQAPTWYLKYVMGNPIKNAFIKGTLHGIGIKNVKWFHHGNATSGTDKARNSFLIKIENYFRNRP
jgi:NAD(P)H dehydrogenase (quinone)